jgi:predicted secreted protein
MNWFTGLILYALIWWVTIFAVLPFGTQPIDDPDQVAGGWRGAPAHPRLWLKAGITTVVAAIIWLGCYALITSGWLSFRSGWLALPAD